MKYATLLISCLIAISCSGTQKNTFLLQGSVKNASEGEIITLSYPVLIDGVWYKEHDTTRVVNGKFTFEGTIDEAVPAYLYDASGEEVYLYIEPGL